MNENELLSLRLECTLFFQGNPYAFETEEGLAVRLGRRVEHIKPVLIELVNSSILEKTGDGDLAIYRYVEPYFASGMEV
ncbi:hypothetical protein [Paenibacillus thermotolerans]|uniref:hypothetical protein n=1 Tax=Paenibacillus thermotolerans TaxID=3027807 RepID=UPI002367E92F|nr:MULTISPECIES: hypothetical protein [unclassified Paenibacillus]